MINDKRVLHMLYVVDYMLYFIPCRTLMGSDMLTSASYIQLHNPNIPNLHTFNGYSEQQLLSSSGSFI